MIRSVRLRRFYNCGRAGGIAVVAVTNHYGGTMVDWAAYIGVGTADDDAVCAEQVAESGCKLSAVDAAHFFPELPMDKWRR